MVDPRLLTSQITMRILASAVILFGTAPLVACAGHSTRQDGDACAAWVASPAQSHWNPERTLLGVGGAPKSDPDAASRARQGGVAELAEQIGVQVRASFVSEQRTARHERSGAAEAGATGAQTDDSVVTRRVETSAETFLVGASVLDTCESRTHVYALVGLDRAELGGFARKRLVELRREVAVQVEEAGQRELEEAWLTAAAAWRGAANRLGEIETLALVARVVSRVPVEDTIGPTAGAAELRASTALSHARVSLSVQSPASADVLHEALRVRLRAIGLPITDVAARERIEARVAIRQPEQAAAGLYVAYASLTLEVELADGKVAFSQAANAKSSGLSPDAAARDVVSRLAHEALPGLVQRALAQLGWPEK
jgi:hypothetical protein